MSLLVIHVGLMMGISFTESDAVVKTRQGHFLSVIVHVNRVASDPNSSSSSFFSGVSTETLSSFSMKLCAKKL